MTGNVTTLPTKPQFWCAVHGQTNNVIGLDRTEYCLDCVIHVVRIHCNRVFRISEIADQS